ncbi:MAG: CHC2 zinc finger domain-containing protein [Xanthobacteraceae bacterium]
MSDVSAELRRQYRDLTMAALLAAKEITAAHLADIAAHPDECDFADGTAAVFREQQAAIDAVLQRRQSLKLSPSAHGGPSADAVKARVDIGVVIERYTNLRKAGRTYRGKCPVHDGLSDGSLAVYPDSQSFYCFGCGIGGDVFDFLMWAAGCDFPGALHLACIETGIPFPKDSTPRQMPTVHRVRVA